MTFIWMMDSRNRFAEQRQNNFNLVLKSTKICNKSVANLFNTARVATSRINIACDQYRLALTEHQLSVCVVSRETAFLSAI